MALVSEEVMLAVSDTLVTTFQLASTALTVTANAPPAAWPVSAPLLPVALPGEADSPGANICNFVNAPAPTAIAGLVLLPIAPCVTSAAVKLALPAVLSVTLNDLLPLTNAALRGSKALGFVEVIATVSLVVTTFQLASTAFTVALNGVPAVWAEGVPILPLAVPGAALSPGVRSCSLTNAPAFTGIEGLVFAVLDGSVKSDAVKVALPAVMRVTLKLCVPLLNAALAVLRHF